MVDEKTGRLSIVSGHLVDRIMDHEHRAADAARLGYDTVNGGEVQEKQFYRTQFSRPDDQANSQLKARTLFAAIAKCMGGPKG